MLDIKNLLPLLRAVHASIDSVYSRFDLWQWKEFLAMFIYHQCKKIDIVENGKLFYHVLKAVSS